MMGLGTLWKAVTGGEGERPVPRSTVPRAVVMCPPAVAEPPWDPADSEPSETRSAERFVPNKAHTVLTTADGKRIPARIINMSRTGVAVETGATAFVPADVTLVGTRPVVPGRRIALGQVFLFKKPIDRKLCGPDILL